MGNRISHIALGAAVVVTPFGVWTSSALAQTYSIVSITPSGTAGTFVAGSSAVTVTLSPSGGFTPALNVMHSPAMTYLVKVKCVNGSGFSARCTRNDMVAVMKDTATVSSTSRLGALLSFTVGSGSETVVSGPSGSNPTTFTLSAVTDAVGSSTSTFTGSFQIGFGIPLLTTGHTGVATTRTFTLGVGLSAGSLTSMSSTLAATVWNPLSIAATGNMNFGKVTAPPFGGVTSTYSLAPGGSLTPSAGGATLSSTGHSAASFNVTGEGSQAFSLNVPASFNMVSAAKTLTVTTATSYGSTSTLTTQSFLGSLGTLGSFPFSVGGVLPVAVGATSGTYTGNLIVSVEYN